ncbi:MAG: hypothetical protein ACPGWR_07240 [Ardenticatenaceae bacterium]
MDEKIKLLLKYEKKLEAVKLVRQENGWGLKESKDYVDRVERLSRKRSKRSRKAPKAPNQGMENRVRFLLNQGKKAEAVQILFEKTTMKRRVAAEYVELLALLNSLHRESDTLEITVSPAVERQARLRILQGDKVEAIKFVYQNSPLRLRDAKQYVETLALTLSLRDLLNGSSINDLSQEQMDHIARQLMSKERKFDAIKLVHQATGMGLRDAKEYVEAL